MNKMVYGIVSLVIIALGAGVFLATGSDSSKPAVIANSPSTVASSAAPSQQPATEIVLPSTGANSILEYSPANLAKSTTKYNILFFHAAWCTVCNSVQRSIEAGSIPDELSIFKVDYDSDEGQALAEQYRIPIQYTMVQVDSKGTEITQWINNFNDGIPEITAHLNNAI